jgi:hypothetical protein
MRLDDGGQPNKIVAATSPQGSDRAKEPIAFRSLRRDLHRVYGDFSVMEAMPSLATIENHQHHGRRRGQPCRLRPDTDVETKFRQANNAAAPATVL